MIGKTISHYRILEKLGEGGMAVVYKAEDTKLDRLVALKFLPPQALGNTEEKTRFVREAKAAAALNHSHICTMYEIDEVEGQSFLSMEYIEGQSLKGKIEARPLKIAEVLDIAIQIAEGLQEAHDKGIVHRDIKSANIMVNDKGQAKIMDFGLAKLLGRTQVTREGATLGTLSYMSPEQTQGKAVDHRADIWSFGVMLYEMIAGQLPFKGDYDQVVVYSIMNEEAEPLTGLRTGVPMELERIVNKALVKSPDERYQRVDEMRVDLKRLKGESDRSGKIQPGKVIRKESDKKRLKQISILAGIVILVVLGFLLLRPLIFEQALISEPKPIAVISFQNQTGDKAYDYLQDAIPNLLITSLEQSRYLRVTTWERMYDLLKQIGKADVETIDKDLGFELCKMDGIHTIVLGSYVKAGNTFVTDVKVLDVMSKSLLKSASAQGEGVASILQSQIDELSNEISRGIDIPDRKTDGDQPPITHVTTTSMEAYNYFLRGREELEKAYNDDARRFLEKAVQLDSTFAVAYLYLGEVQGYLRNYEARDEAYKNAKKFSLKATEKERLYVEAAYAWRIEKNPEKQFRILKQMANKYPREKRVHSALGYYYIGRRMNDEALAEFHTAIELDPNWGDALNQLGYLYIRKQDFEKAIEYFKKYASASPGDANPFDSMGETYFRIGKLEESLIKFKEAIEVKPGFYPSYPHIAYNYALKENYPEAMKRIEEFINVAPSPSIRSEGYFLRGFYNYWLGRMNRALSDLDKAAELDSLGIAEGDLIKGSIYYEKGELHLSGKYFKSHFEFWIKRFPDRIASLTASRNFYLGLVDLNEGRIDSAKSRLVEMKSLLSRIDPPWKDIGEFHYDLLHAEVLLSENATDKAIVVAENAAPLEMNRIGYSTIVLHNLPFLKDVLARAYRQKGELDKAIAIYEQLTAADPNTRGRRLIYPKHRYRLAKLYEERGWPAKATEQYMKMMEIWKDADKDLPVLIDAKARLAKLKGVTNK